MNSSLQTPVSDFFGLFSQNAGIGCWILDLQSSSFSWPENSHKILGIAEENKTLSFHDFLNKTVHPAERYLVTASIKNYLYYHASSHKHEIRMRHGNGQYHWYETFGEVRHDEQGKPEYIVGGFINIDEKKRQEEESKKLKFILDIAEKMMGVGMFETDFVSGNRNWSDVVREICELPPNASLATLKRSDFFDEADGKILNNAITELRKNKKPFDLELRLITAKRNAFWVRLMGKPVIDDEGNVISLRGMIQKIERQKLKENFLIDIRNKISEQKFFLNETSAMAHVGGWEVNLEQDTVDWSEQIKRIYEVDNDYVPHFEKFISFYCDPSREILLEHFSRLVEHGELFDLELEITTARNNKKWVRSIGKPVFDKSGKTISVRGMLQDITALKQRELDLNTALSLINGQNDKLKDFAFIVSHNLRSHTGNLKMIAEMIEIETDVNAKLEWINLIKDVSLSLNDTVTNLTGVVSSNVQEKRCLYFNEVFTSIQKALNFKLDDEKAQFNIDFSQCESIIYVPAYLESIMLNLVTNAIKYKHPKREPVISLRTFIQNDRICLQVSDNGLGIDLQAHGNRLFKMNQTFHHNADARGIGLYITKNQIENLGGSIQVNSIVNEGTTFTIHF